jgi:hypothetical protein
MEKVMKKIQLKIVAENTVGLLSEITGMVADKGINIEDTCAYVANEKVIIYLLTNDNEKAKEVLVEKGYHIEDTEAIILRLWNRPGSLSAVTTKFRQHGINLQYLYGTSSLGGERMTFVFSSDNNDKASKVFDSMVIDEADKTM